jgi:hypothetical protein
MEKNEEILKEAEEEAKRIHDLETPSTNVTPVVDNTPKKGGNGKDIIIIVLIILLVIAGVVILFTTGVVGGKTKNSNKNSEKQNVVENTEITNTENVVENTEKTNTENVEKPVDTPKYQEEQLTVDSPVVQRLYNLFHDQFEFNGVRNIDENKIKIAATLKDLDPNDIVTETCGDLSNYIYTTSNEYGETRFICNTGDILELENPYTHEFTAEGLETIKNTSIKTITLEKFNKNYKRLFGTEPTEAPKSLYLGCADLLYYDEVNELYAFYFFIPNSGCIGPTSANLDAITQENGNLILHVSYNLADGNQNNLLYNIDITFKFDETTGDYVFVSMNVNPVG